MDCMRNSFVAGVLLDGRFRTISPLNHGSFGMVFKALDTYTNEFVALKCLTKNSASNVCLSAIAIDERSEELSVHRRIGDHPNIVNLVHSFETASHIYLVLEFCSNGDLYEAIRVGRGPLQTEHVRSFMFELIGAVEHMHKNGIYHRDIKPENIFLTQTGVMKLGDFGLATKDTWSMECAVGSDRYMAPEQYDPSGNGYNPARADVWSIGICLLNILFSRNPFATPTPSDPLYRDFVADRQTLFDVFPTMSQDTFEVLVHCLAIDPANRSLTAAKEALKRVVSFTTDDEALDDFCTDERSVALATANREPLRTPSISTPQIEGGAFPWAKALAMSPPQQIRQLSAIPDTEISESLFPSSEDVSKDWVSSKPDTASIASFVDSGLGVSVKSSNTIPQPLGEPIKVQRSKPVLISGSLPISAARPIGSLANALKGRDTMSKSWSDMYEEDEEAAESSDIENSTIFGFGGPLKAIKSKDWGYESSDGRSTPRNRVGLTELKNPSTINNSRNRSPQAAHEQEVDERISETTGFLFEEHSSPLATPTKPRKSDFLDKWAKLGARRRADPESKSATTSGSATPKQSTATKREAGQVVTPRKRSQTRVGSWR
ncbi:kinase-like protein, partial [Rhizodiscina lignyota]